MRERAARGCRGAVVAVQRRGCHVAIDYGTLLILSRPDVPLAPNALTIAAGPADSLERRGVCVGQLVALDAIAPGDHDVDWVVTLREAATWEPRPPIHPLGSRELAARLRTIRATVVADGAEASLLPLLWSCGAADGGLQSAIVRLAAAPARLLGAAAIRGDVAALSRAARGLAGLGPGLTPSGDDLLAGFVASWTLVGEALGRDLSTRERVTAAVVAGGERGASPLGHAWLEHARCGELLEPMTRFVADLLAEEPGVAAMAARGVLAVGSSSGTDWMVGFLLAAKAMLDATPWGPPW